MYEINAVDNQLGKPEQKTIPRPPFSLCVCASKGGGKSSLLINLLIKNEFYHNKFNQVYWVSPTHFLDAKLDILRKTSGIKKINHPLLNEIKRKRGKSIVADPIPEKITKTSLSDTDFVEDLTTEWLEELIKSQKAIITEHGKKLSDEVLVVLDDSISSKIIRTAQFKKFLLNSRHYNISTVFSTQSYMMLERNIRLNNSFICVFSVPSMTNLKQIWDENPAGLDWNDWYQVYMYATKRPFGFLSINYQNDLKHRLINGFSEFLCIE